MYPVLYYNHREGKKERKGKKMEFMDLMEVMGKSLVEVVEWALAHEFDEDELDCGDEDYYEEHLEEKDFDGELYFGGFWSDEAPVVVFKQGVAVKFYRAPAWD